MLRNLLKLAAPVAAAHLANMAMQVVDTMFVGRLGPIAIGGVGIGSAAYYTAMIAGLGVLLGLDYCISHSFGAKRIADCHEYLVQGLYLATVLAFPLTIILYKAASWFAFFGVTSAVASSGEIYLRALCWSLWPFFLFAVLRQYLQALGVALPVLFIMVLANIVNAAANWVFVFGHLGLQPQGVAGAGIATTIARIFQLIAIIFYIYSRERRRDTGLRLVRRQWLSDKVRKVVHLGLPIAGQMMLEVGVFATSTILMGRLTAEALAAHQIVLQIASVTFMVPLGISAAAAVQVGHAIGAGHNHVAIKTGWISIATGAAIMAVSGVCLYVFATPILHLYTQDATVIRVATTLLLLAALFQLADGIQVVSTGVLRGAGTTRSSMLANLAGHWFLGLPLGTALCFHYHLGAAGLWIGLSVGLISVAALLLWAWSIECRKISRN